MTWRGVLSHAHTLIAGAAPGLEGQDALEQAAELAVAVAVTVAVVAVAIAVAVPPPPGARVESIKSSFFLFVEGAALERPVVL